MYTIRQLFLYLLATISINVQAQVIVDTGPVNDASLAFGIFNNPSGDYQKLAGNFVLQSSYTVTDIYASLVYYDFDSIKPNAVINVSVHNDKNNQPGEQLFSGQITIPTNPPFPTSPDAVYVSRPLEWKGLSNISLSLNSGSYWIVFSGVEPNYVGWMAGAINPLSSYMLMSSSNEPPLLPFLPFGPPHTWIEIGAVGFSPGLKILGTPLAVPEPESAVMLLVGLGLLSIVSRRSKRV